MEDSISPGLIAKNLLLSEDVHARRSILQLYDKTDKKKEGAQQAPQLAAERAAQLTQNLSMSLSLYCMIVETFWFRTDSDSDANRSRTSSTNVYSHEVIVEQPISQEVFFWIIAWRRPNMDKLDHLLHYGAQSKLV